MPREQDFLRHDGRIPGGGLRTVSGATRATVGYLVFTIFRFFLYFCIFLFSCMLMYLIRRRCKPQRISGEKPQANTRNQEENQPDPEKNEPAAAR